MNPDKDTDFDNERQIYVIFGKLHKNNCHKAYQVIIKRIASYFSKEYIIDNSFDTEQLLDVIITFFSKDFPNENYVESIKKALTNDELQLLITNFWIYSENELKRILQNKSY